MSFKAFAKINLFNMHVHVHTYIHPLGLCGAKHYQQGENREKRRLNNINSAFECLKKVIPTFPFEKRLTKIDTLRLAISYIQMLEAILKSEQHPEIFIGQLLDGRITSEWYTHGKEIGFICMVICHIAFCSMSCVAQIKQLPGN